MDPHSGLLSPLSRACSHLAEICMEGERSPSPQEQGSDSPFPWSLVPDSSLADPDWFWDEHIQAKRARVETIVRGMCLSPDPLVPGNVRARDSLCCPGRAQERKRKQSLPVQQGPLKSSPARGHGSRKGGPRVREQLHLLKQQLRHLQEHILQAAEPQDTAQGPGGSEKGRGPLSVKQKNGCGSRPWAMDSDHHQVSSGDLSGVEKHRVSEVEYQSEEPRFLRSAARALLESLRKELTGAVSQAVDSVLQKFNRCIISQMIKWFSNFREFYYIQMEKFARQAISDGVTNPKMLMVLRDSELFRALNTHYNRGNDFEVPDCFLEIASLTLQEFFRAVSTGKDSDPSWKKPIYKIISKLDSDIPEIFKSSSYPQELFRN
ncbi:PREDICTED: prospero homeobox protein 2 isoform X2 [Ceratotherium simum simum]|uniref:Prospero homeobox protein 2 isoform X2 n=1 Tax=Ceratotherium simum simum TaxID=73337 RepID=A0ABM1CK20_CERSS|nr:PREDICTED: prospero homeobox protein 2 isoform X2 [Ceratotherium simum simum]